MTSKVTAPDGRIIVVEHPDGASDKEIIGLARRQHPRGMVAKAAPPPTAPDVVGRAKESLLAEPPLGARTPVSRALFGERLGSWDVPGRAVRAAGDILFPASVPEAARLAATLPIGGGLVSGPLMRVAAGGIAGAGASLAQGRDLAPSLMTGGTEALSQFAGELLPVPLRVAAQRQAKGLLRTREAKVAHDRAMHGAVTGLEQEGYKTDVAAQRATEAARVREARAQHQEVTRDLKATHETRQATQAAAHEAAVRTYAEQGAETIADAFKAHQPAWRDLPSNEHGLLDMVYGKGPRLASERYDASLKEVVSLGRGRMVEIPAEDAKFYRLKISTLIADRVSRDRDVAKVDAGALAEKMTGTWQKNRQAYGRASRALDEAGIGDATARAEYKATQALLEFTDRSQMLKGQRFNPEAAREGFTRLKIVDQLRRRGAGNIFEGPIAEAVNRPAPGTPTPLTPPTLPVFRRPAPLPEIPKPPARVLLKEPMPEGVRTRTLPKMTFWQGAALAELPFLVSGLATGHYGFTPGHGLSVSVGGLVSGALSGRQVVTHAPLTSLGRFAEQTVPSVAAQPARRQLESLAP